MGDFDDHLNYGVAAHVLASAGLVGAVYTTPLPLLTAVAGFIALPVTIAGAAFPDIDHHASKPNRIFKQLLAGAALLITAYLFGQYGFRPTFGWLQTAAPTGTALPLTTVIAVLVALAGGYLSQPLFDTVRPRHRGFTHRVPVGSGVAATVGLCAWTLSTLTGVAMPLVSAGVIGGLFFVGFLSHLACDGLLFKIETYTRLT